MRIDAEALEQPEGVNKLKGMSGILVPGGFGDRGIEENRRGEIRPRKRYTLFRTLPWLANRGNRIRPQCARSRRLIATKLMKTPHPVISMMDEQVSWKRGDYAIGIL